MSSNVTDPSRQLERLVETSLQACQSWLEEDSEGGLRMIDPVDDEAIVSHYGDSHLAAALVILGQMRNDSDMVDRGLQVVRTIMRDWQQSVKIGDFHHDFNCFALCLIDECIHGISIELSKAIRQLVLSTHDSRHDTINWLPMRAYANRSRYEWTGERRYLDASDRSLGTIRRATNDDGGIEDRLPVGSSYNLQYNVSSLATLQLMSKRWPSLALDLDQSLDFLLGRMLPDGDINYMGRGTNQIFAWGPWLYTVSFAEKEGALNLALGFLRDRYARATKNHNILLNDFHGREKSFWWDYHFCSVYHAHFLLWCVLALRDYGSGSAAEGASDRSGTGLKFALGEFGGVCVFEGRATYLAEAGPSICALWLSDRGVLFKGGLGPWRGMFGKKYSFADTTFQNHFGLISESTTWRFGENRFVRRLARASPENRRALIRPVFAEVRSDVDPDKLSVIFETSGLSAYLNVPIFDQQADQTQIELSVDDQILESIVVGKSRNQYGWIAVTRSRLAHGRRWKVTFR